MSNQNCLKGICCPKCSQEEQFKIAAAITGHAYCVHTSMARTTRAVIVFMSWSAGWDGQWGRRIDEGV